jgi:hypothetical protein
MRVARFRLVTALSASMALVPTAMSVGVSSSPAVDVPVEVHGFEQVGVTLVSPLTPGFDARVQKLVRDATGLSLKLKPCLTIIRNDSTRRVVAYALTFAFKRNRAGETDTGQNRSPDAVAGARPGASPFPRGDEILPGEERAEAPELRLMHPGEGENEWFTTNREFFSEFADEIQGRLTTTERLSIEIDAVIFDDGEIVGRDTSNLKGKFLTDLQARQDLYRKVLGQLETGQSVAAVFSALEPKKPPTEAELQEVLTNPYLRYAINAAVDLQNERSRVGDKAIRDILKRAIRTSPFEIYRK